MAAAGKAKEREAKEETVLQVQPQTAAAQATLALLEQWAREDASSDPAKVAAAERELAEFKQAMNETRAANGELPLYP